MKPRGLCRWIGHKFDPHDRRSPYYVAVCTRCGDSDHDDSLEMAWIEWGRFWLATWARRVRLRIRDIKSWWRCPICGGRFGKHDESECFPF